MIPLKTVNDLINKHASLEKELSSEEIDKKSFAEKSKEYADLNEIIQIANLYTINWRLFSYFLFFLESFGFFRNKSGMRLLSTL